MTTQTRTPAQIYVEIEQMSVAAIPTLGDMTAVQYAEHQERKATLWAELRAAVGRTCEPWALAALCHVVVDTEERAERARKRADAVALRDLPRKETK